MAFVDEFSEALVVGGNPDVTVYEARDHDGRPVVAAVMTPFAASLRPQLRQAFVEAAEDAANAAEKTSDGPVVSVDVTADRPWVAVSDPPGLPALRDVLAAVHVSVDDILSASGEGDQTDHLSDSASTPEAVAGPGEEAEAARPTYPLPGMPRRPTVAVWGVVAVIAALGVVAVTAFHLFWPGPESSSADPVRRPSPVRSLATPPFVSPSRIPPQPTLKRLPPVSLAGPVFGAKETTQVVHPRTLPFAFRVPASWECYQRSILPGGVGYTCDSSDDTAGARVTMFVRRCRAVCTAAEFERFGQDWLDAPVRYQKKDATTQLADVSGHGYYRLVVSHLFRDSAKRLTWHVGIVARATPTYTATVQKVVNDIRTQTP